MTQYPRAFYEGPNYSLGQAALLDRLNQVTTGEVAVDVETVDLTDLRIIGIGFAINPDDTYFFPIGSPYLPFHLLLNPDLVKIFHNGHFDLRAIKENWGIEPTNIRDTIIAAQLLGHPPSLAALALQFFNASWPTIKDLIGSGVNQLDMTEVPIDQVAHKCCMDVKYAYMVWQKIKADLPKAAFDLEMKVLPVIMSIEERGMMVNTLQLEEYIKRIQQEVSYYRAIARGYGFNPASSKQVAAILQYRGYPIRYNRTTGNPVMNEEMLKTYYADDPISQLTLLFRHQNVLLRNTLIPIRDKHLDFDNKIHPRIHQNITNTGRFSTSRPNVQNITVPLRDLIIPDPGYILEDWDLSQIELRVLAYLSQDKTLLGVFAHNGDIHSETSIFMFGDANPVHRRISKDINFAVVYGGDAYTLYTRSGIPLHQGEEFIAQHRRVYPGVWQYIADTKAFAHQHGYTETLGGRRRLHPDINASEHWLQEKAERESVNHPIQGMAGEILKELMVRLASQPQINTVHDESLMLRDMASSPDYGVVENLAPFRTPTEVKLGYNWRDVKRVMTIG